MTDKGKEVYLQNGFFILKIKKNASDGRAMPALKESRATP